MQCLALGNVCCSFHATQDKLVADAASLLTKLKVDKPDLVMILSGSDPNVTVDPSVQVASRLMMSTQREGGRHCVLENINDESSTSRRIFIPPDGSLSDLSRIHVWWCALQMPECLSKKQPECHHTFLATSLFFKDELQVCCKKSQCTGRSLLPSTLPKAYYQKLLTHVTQALHSDLDERLNAYAAKYRKQKPKPPKPGVNDGPEGDHDVQDAEIIETPSQKIRNKMIEEHYDDCGTDISSIATENYCVFDSDSECEFDDYPSMFSPSFFMNGMRGSEYQEDTEVLTYSSQHHVFNSMQSAWAFMTQNTMYSGQHDICEICGGKAGTTQILLRRGMTPGLNFDLSVNVNLCDPAEQAKLWSYLVKHQPRVILTGPPCTSFGAWAHYNKVHNHAAWKHSHVIGLTIARLVANICHWQSACKRHWIIENPASSAIWHLPEYLALLNIPGVCSTVLDQCMVGLVDPTGSPTRKSTLLLATAWPLIRRLNRRCLGNHIHTQLAGNVWGVSRCKYAQTWPKRMLELIADGVEETLQLQSFKVSAFPAIEASPTCPGCKAHACRDDIRHHRGPGCRFPLDASVSWTCPACVRHRSSTHTGHTFGPDCQWAVAPQRRGFPRDAAVDEVPSNAQPSVPAPLRPLRIPAHTPPVEAPPDVSDALVPPKILDQAWSPCANLETIQLLDNIKRLDGWHSVKPDVAFVAFNGRWIRSPEPRFAISQFTTRSTFGYFPDCSHINGHWWQWDDHTPSDSTVLIPYAVPILIKCIMRLCHAQQKT